MSKMYEIKYLQQASTDLDEIYFYISQDSPQNATKMLNEIVDKIEMLGEFPLIGSRVDDKLTTKGEYRMVIARPYLIFYRVIGDTVYIYRVLHGKRYYNALLD